MARRAGSPYLSPATWWFDWFMVVHRHDGNVVLILVRMELDRVVDDQTVRVEEQNASVGSSVLRSSHSWPMPNGDPVPIFIGLSAVPAGVGLNRSGARCPAG